MEQSKIIDTLETYHQPKMSFNALSGISNALDISYIIAQAMPKFTEKSFMTFAKKGHIERLKFARTEINQHSGKI